MVRVSQKAKGRPPQGSFSDKGLEGQVVLTWLGGIKNTLSPGRTGRGKGPMIEGDMGAREDSTGGTGGEQGEEGEVGRT